MVGLINACIHIYLKFIYIYISFYIVQYLYLYFNLYFFVFSYCILHCPLCCCNLANFPTVGLIKDYLILSFIKHSLNCLLIVNCIAHAKQNGRYSLALLDLMIYLGLLVDVNL